MVEGRGQIALPQGLIMQCNFHERVVQSRQEICFSSTVTMHVISLWREITDHSFLSVTLIFLLTINVITQGQGGQCMRREITCESWRKTQVKNGSL